MVNLSPQQQDELNRAREHRRQMEARNVFKLQRESQMKGNHQAYVELLNDYAPLLPDAGWDPPTVVPEDVDDRLN